eukprot:CAMPEP_0115121838 /NCGR_PEP_ID=MMETSP0227-20121206/46470_1 /TAXON_ID=89957 /ORGANISM="Polarella glacialis, Strain CCMP 1383" /LENGTH=322 /DNA_ID=CAMNT_0002523665 /DNA_START=77 /DNA_END=1045 /DNA_ORIENTATION=-
MAMAMEERVPYVGLNVIVKNTFLDVDEGDCEGSRKRFSSVPRTWKPVSPSCSSDRLERLSISTSASVGSFSETGSDRGQGTTSPSSPESSVAVARPNKPKLNAGAAVFSMPQSPASVATTASPMMVPMSPMMMPMSPMMSPMIGQFAFEMMPGMMKLNPEARIFEPALSSTGEIAAMISAAKGALLGSKHVAGVEVETENATPGAPTVLHVELHETTMEKDREEVVCAAKAALIAAAEHSQNTYVLGYAATPFQDFDDSTGFRATIGSIPDHMQDFVCWDTYQKGFCTNQGDCRACHPMPSNVSPMTVRMKKKSEMQDAGSA